MKKAAEAICKLGPVGVLVKGGHLEEPTLVDLFYYKGEFHMFSHERIDTRDHHGTGCTLSAAIAAELAAGTETVEAVREPLITLGLESNIGSKEEKVTVVLVTSSTLTG